MARPKTTTHKKLKVVYRGNSIHLYGYDNDAEQPTPVFIATVKQNVKNLRSDYFLDGFYKNTYKDGVESYSKKILYIRKSIYKDIGNMFKEFSLCYSIDEYTLQDENDKRKKVTAEYKADCEQFLKNLQDHYYARVNYEIMNIIEHLLWSYKSLFKNNKIEVDEKQHEWYIDAINNLLYCREFEQLQELPASCWFIGFNNQGDPFEDKLNYTDAKTRKEYKEFLKQQEQEQDDD